MKGKSFELTNDNYYNLSVRLNSIDSTSQKANITMKSIHEKIPSQERREEAPSNQTEAEPADQEEGIDWFTWIVVISSILIIIVLIILFLNRKKSQS